MLPPKDMSAEQVRQILSEIVVALEAPEFKTRLEQAKLQADNDVVKKLKIVYPIVQQLEISIIESHGYDSSTEGLVEFAERIRDLESLDKEVARLHLLVRNHYLSPDSISSMVDMLTRA